MPAPMVVNVELLVLSKKSIATQWENIQQKFKNRMLEQDNDVCRTTEKLDIATTPDTLKKRISGHFDDMQKLIMKGIRSDSFAEH